MNLDQAKIKAKNQIREMMLSSTGSVNHVLAVIDQIKPVTRSILCGVCGNKIVVDSVPEDVNIRPGVVIMCSRCKEAVDRTLEDIKTALEAISGHKGNLTEIISQAQRIKRGSNRGSSEPPEGEARTDE